MSASPKVALRSVASVVSQVASPVALVASIASSVASRAPKVVLSRALLRARELRQADLVKRIAQRRRIDTASRDPGCVIGSASSQRSQVAGRLH
jgi:hypothetical protein